MAKKTRKEHNDDQNDIHDCPIDAQCVDACFNSNGDAVPDVYALLAPEDEEGVTGTTELDGAIHDGKRPRFLTPKLAKQAFL